MAALVIIFTMIILSRKQVAYWKDSITLCKHATEATENNYLMYDNYGRLLGQKGDYKAAMQNLSKACAISPRYTPAINNLGMALKGMGQTKEAIQKWEGALLIDPNDRDVNYNLGTTMMELGNYDKAIVYFEKVLKNKPDFVEVLNNMAYALAVIGNPKVRNPGRAVELAAKACELTGNKQPVFLDTLAIAYAASGDFTKAVNIAEQAARMSRSIGDAKMAEEIRSHIELFKKKISVVEFTEVSR
jgi:tetratricopeptide (TPR) repeat protein